MWVELEALLSSAFEAFDTTLQIGETLLEGANTALELRVGESDHRLRFGGAAFNLLVKLSGRPVNRVPGLRD